jgi:hypothetical protein
LGNYRISNFMFTDASMTNNVSARAKNIEQSRELNTYARSHGSATRSQHESDWPDNGPIVPYQDDEDWQINADSDRVSGQGDNLSNTSADVGDAMSMADDRGPCDDMYVTQIPLYINTDYITCLFQGTLVQTTATPLWATSAHARLPQKSKLPVFVRLRYQIVEGAFAPVTS